MADRDELIAQLIEQAVMTPGIATVAEYIAAVVDGALAADDGMGGPVGPHGGRRIAIIEPMTLDDVSDWVFSSVRGKYPQPHRIVTPDPEEGQ